MHKKIKVWAYTFLVLLFILFSIDFYLNKKYYLPTIEEFLVNPAPYDGMEAEFTGHISGISDNSFYMSTNKRMLKAYYSNVEKPKLGQIYILARLNKDGTATAIEVHYMSYNYLKYIISLGGLFIFLYTFFKEWKFKKWRLVENA